VEISGNCQQGNRTKEQGERGKTIYYLAIVEFYSGSLKGEQKNERGS